MFATQKTKGFAQKLHCPLTGTGVATAQPGVQNKVGFSQGKSAYLAHVTENSPVVFPLCPLDQSSARRFSPLPRSRCLCRRKLLRHRSTPYEFTSSIERLEESLMRKILDGLWCSR